MGHFKFGSCYNLGLIYSYLVRILKELYEEGHEVYISTMAGYRMKQWNIERDFFHTHISIQTLIHKHTHAYMLYQYKTIVPVSGLLNALDYGK